MSCFEDALVVLWAVVDLDFIFGQAVLVLGFADMELIEDDGISSRMARLSLNTALVMGALGYDYIKDGCLAWLGWTPAYMKDRKAWRVKQAERVTGHLQMLACAAAYAYTYVVGAGGDLVGSFVMKVLASAEGSFDITFVLPIFVPALEKLAENVVGRCFESMMERSLIWACRGMVSVTVLFGIGTLVHMSGGAGSYMGLSYGTCGLLIYWLASQFYISVFFRFFAGAEPGAEKNEAGKAEVDADVLGVKI
eukprot:TRINITY_DN852_c0_g1_i1.p1 TRINITY_DN852_c0_g1~~TRINITY_DN852_c0_g1_i1.p1  ORF type:complete len:251 (+),score=44.44 TRINITY_DN852_c0_g1_i1:105-857(+)